MQPQNVPGLQKFTGPKNVPGTLKVLQTLNLSRVPQNVSGDLKMFKGPQKVHRTQKVPRAIKVHRTLKFSLAPKVHGTLKCSWDHKMSRDPKSRQLRVELLIHFHFPILKNNFSTKMFVGPQNVLGTIKCSWDPKMFVGPKKAKGSPKAMRSQNVPGIPKCPRDLKMSQGPQNVPETQNFMRPQNVPSKFISNFLGIDISDYEIQMTPMSQRPKTS